MHPKDNLLVMKEVMVAMVQPITGFLFRLFFVKTEIWM